MRLRYLAIPFAAATLAVTQPVAANPQSMSEAVSVPATPQPFSLAEFFARVIAPSAGMIAGSLYYEKRRIKRARRKEAYAMRIFYKGRIYGVYV